MATHSSILAWRIPSIGSQRIGHDWASNTNTVLLLSCKMFFTFWINVLSQINVVQIFSPSLYLESNKQNCFLEVWLIFNKLNVWNVRDRFWHLQAAVKPSPQSKLNMYVLPCFLYLPLFTCPHPVLQATTDLLSLYIHFLEFYINGSFLFILHFFCVFFHSVWVGGDSSTFLCVSINYCC